MNGISKPIKLRSESAPARKPQTLIPKSKYEFNLAEFPVTLLYKRPPTGHKEPEIYEYQDTITGKGGKPIPRTWRIKPSADYGFGSSQLLAILFELFQIWKEQKFDSPYIRFGSVYQLIKRTDLQNTESAHQRIRRDLNALVEISIEAKNAFWDNERGAYVDRTFHLFDQVDFYHTDPSNRGQQSLPFASIKASETLWGSIEANALFTLKQIDSKLFHTLTPTEQRLALYLGKMLRKATEHRRDVRTFARQIPLLAKTYRDSKKQLTRACDGLIKKGFPYLTEYHYELKQDGRGENIVFRRDPAYKPAAKHLLPRGKEPGLEEFLVGEILDVTRDPRSRDFYTLVTQKLDSQTVYRALSEVKAEDIPQGTIRNRGAYFTHLITKYAAEQGITLNPQKRE